MRREPRRLPSHPDCCAAIGSKKTRIAWRQRLVPRAAVAAAIIATVGLRFGLIDFESATVKVLPVEFFLGRISFRFRIHLDEAEALRAARIPVCYHLARFHRADLAEQISNLIAGSLIREITHKQFS